ncbi:MAG: hypothetical protein WC697_01180 [Patescibacteria group bacterium]|jgi:glutathione synthase/RimK-type ligase-like ATP-grasp enzyme
MGITIINSIEESFVVFADNLKKSLISKGIDCNTVYIEELVFSDFNNLKKEIKDVVYIFNNNRAISVLASLLIKNGKQVINGGYFIKNCSKYAAQFLLSENNIKVPKNYFSPELTHSSSLKDEFNFPLILKSFRHMEKNYVINNYAEYIDLMLDWANKEPHYFEEYCGDCIFFKIYAINGSIFFDKAVKEYTDESLIGSIKKIREIFSLEVYSVDCLFNKEKNISFIIDVNPSPAFKGLLEAKNYFFRYLEELGNKL